MNIYTDPEKFGLTPVTEVDLADSYEFDLFVVWRRTDGKLAWATDSGCSCPIPFDEVGISDLTVGGSHEAYDALQTWHRESYRDKDATIIGDAVEAIMKEAS